MYRKGHIGTSLAVFAPFGFVLARVGRLDLAVVAGAVMVWLAMLPDTDQRIPGVAHRGVTHTLAFALLVGAAFGAVGAAVGGDVPALDAPLPGVTLGVFGFGLGFVTVVAHLLADALTPMGVMFLWPLSRRRYSLSLATADNPIANYALFLGGVVVAGLSLWAATA